jgi:hypothetical protein
VAGVMAALAHTGCDFLLDVHGDEEVPGVFISGLEGLPGWGPRLAALQGAFVGEWVGGLVGGWWVGGWVGE